MTDARIGDGIDPTIYNWATRVGVRVTSTRVIGDDDSMARTYSVPGYGACDVTIRPWTYETDAHDNALLELRARCEAIDDFTRGVVAATYAPPVFLP